VSLAATVSLLGAATAPAQAAKPKHSADIAHALQATMDGLHFEQVLDLAPPAPPTSAARTAMNAARASVDKDAAPPTQRFRGFDATTSPQPIVQQPQADTTVIELDSNGRPVSSGTVLMSPQYPHGVIVPVDGDLHTDQVRWRQWDDAGWYTNHAQGTIDTVPGRENAPIDYMEPYPASVLKLMANFGVLRLVDRGVISLDDTYHYLPESTSSVSLCGEESTDTVRNYIDASLTFSSNAASCALIKLLWDHDAVDELNQTFQDLGLETLQLKNTNKLTGGHWDNNVTMTSLDTAKLLMLINGTPGTAWTAPNGTPVTSDVLTPSSRRFFKDELRQQGFNDVLSTTSWCGADYPAPGIPQVTAPRWINSDDGTTTVDGALYGHDVRPCNRHARVTFAHKTGLVNNSGSDAGIVTPLPGESGHSYIIAMFSNLGDQYQDPNRPPTAPGAHPVAYTEKFAKLGLAIDRIEARRR
jgi:hypothetical protein